MMYKFPDDIRYVKEWIGNNAFISGVLIVDGEHWWVVSVREHCYHNSPKALKEIAEMGFPLVKHHPREARHIMLMRASKEEYDDFYQMVNNGRTVDWDKREATKEAMAEQRKQRKKRERIMADI